MELRLNVYAYLLHRFGLRLDHNDNVPDHGGSEADLVNAVCRTSRLIRAESIPILAQQCKVNRNLV